MYRSKLTPEEKKARRREVVRRSREKRMLDPAKRERWLEQKKASYRRTLLTALVGKARIRAEQRGVPFDLKTDDLTIPALCPILGIPISVADGAVADGSPSLDRLRPELGYVAGNVEIISYRANTLKRDGTFNEIERLYLWMKEKNQ